MSIIGNIRLASILTIIGIVLGFASATTYAETYNVNASVPYEAPTQAAVIDSSDDGSVFTDVQQTISGSCQVQNPATVVSIWQNGASLGSIGCQSGRFSISVILSIGQNTIIARTANASGIYGPNSLPKTFMVNTPVPAKPLPPAVNQPTSAEDRTAATNQGELSGLSLAVDTPFAVLPSDKQATIRIVVSGGQQPYILQLKWGDGSTEAHTLTEPGTYEYTHTYLVHKTYTVYAYVRDVFGAYTEYIYAIISGNKSPTSATNNSAGGSSSYEQTGPWRFVGIIWYYWLVIAFVILFLLSSYWLGYRSGRDRSEAEAKKQALATKRKKKKAKNK